MWWHMLSIDVDGGPDDRPTSPQETEYIPYKEWLILHI